MKIYFTTNNCSTDFIKEVATLEEAIEYISTETKESMKANEGHGCTDDVFNSSAVCQYEVYKDDIVTIDEEGDEEFNDPIYTSDYFYTDTVI